MDKRILMLPLAVIACAVRASAETVDLASPAGTLTFETERGAIVALRAKDKPGVILRSSSEIGLWSWAYASGSGVYARHFSAASADKHFSWRRLDGGLEFAYEAPFAKTVVRVKPDARGFLFQSRIEAHESLPHPIREVWVPSRLVFAPEETEEVVFPMGGNHGLGLALSGTWFGDQEKLPHLSRTNAWTKTNFFRQAYPATFCDFARLVKKDGSACAVYGVQRRPPHELWKPERIFVPAGWMARGGVSEGGISHSFCPWIRAGETWSSPVVRLDLAPTLEAALDGYASANGIGRPLSDKAPPALVEKLKKAVLVKCGWSAADVRAALPHLPVPSIVHCAEYIRGGFDSSYPDHLPPNARFGTEAEFHALQEEARRMGHLVMPYTNPTWWCDNPKGPTFERIGEGPLLKGPDGSVHREKYGKKATGFTTTLWHPEVRKANAVTMDQFTRQHPVDILFQDQCGCRICYRDFSPFSPKPWAYSEAMIQMVREDSARVPLATESGWDRVADYETILCGLGMWIAPRKDPSGPSELRRKWRPDTWRVEPLALRLCHDKCFFTFHDLGHFTDPPRTRAWAVALGYGMSTHVRGDVLAGDPERQRALRALGAVQTRVIAHLAAKRLVSFRHDQRQALLRDAEADTSADDGEVVARYGDMRVRVNLGDVPRTVDGAALGPYGYCLDGPGVFVTSDEVEKVEDRKQEVRP